MVIEKQISAGVEDTKTLYQDTRFLHFLVITFKNFICSIAALLFFYCFSACGFV